MARHIQTQPLRYWRRIATPALPWRPWGLVTVMALGGLYLVGAILVLNMEDIPEPRLTALAPDEAKRTNKPAPGVEPSRHHDLVLTKVNDRLVLRGEIPTDERRSSLIAAASTQFKEVDDRLKVTGTAARQVDRFAATNALLLLADMDRGQVIWSQGVFSSSGLVSAEREQVVRERFANLASTIQTDGLNLRVGHNAVACDRSFAAALNRSTITFATGAATIDASSEGLLQELAGLARQCPRKLVIEGHTDNIGRPRFNRDLSLARAEAVREALIRMKVESARLSAKGFGASQPIADNNSREGRAKNRRIVIRTAEEA
ncbi:MAG: OmpA family protein [Pseudomonadales bacterium]